MHLETEVTVMKLMWIIALIFAILSVANGGFLLSKSLSRAMSVVLSTSLLISPALAEVDCQSDCYKNCLIAAPKSADYCQSSCTDYCSDPDREDGLSGSKSASKGETGIFGGSIDGTTIKDLPPKSPINFIDPALSTKYGISKSRIDSSSRHK